MNKHPKDLKIIFLDILTDDKALRKRINQRIYPGTSYSEDTRKSFGLKPSEWLFVDGTKGKFPADFSPFDGLIIGGSLENPVGIREKEWIRNVYPFLRKAVKTGLPILGICGGLQFITRALGGRVIYNPNGREFGTIKLRLNNRGRHDKLFYGIPASFKAQASHGCMAGKIPSRGELLGSSGLCAYQAITLGKNVKLLQFHPEMKLKQLKSLASWRKKKLIREGFWKSGADFKKFMQSSENTERTGKKILRNFLKFFILPYHKKRLAD